MQVDPNVMNRELGIPTEDEINDLLDEVNMINPDQPIYPGGPPESVVASWKKQFGDVYLTDVSDQGFIWRTLSRIEYKQIVSIPNTDPLIREEMICETCVLWPMDYDAIGMGGDKAGIPSMLSEQIMEKSAFTRMILPQKL